MESSGGEADINSHILIGNNTCHYNSCSGITVYGTMDANNAGQVTLVNNIVSTSMGTGISFGDGWMCSIVTNTGYYDNYHNKNWDFNEIDPVEANDYPYVPFVWLYGCYLKQNCPFINAGLEYVEETPLIGMTTDYYNSLPDGEKTDLGFHHPNWGYWNAGLTTLRADFDNDFAVDYNDLYALADCWLFDYDEAERDRRPDLYPDGRVNFRDFAILANEWGKTSGRHPEISVSVTGDVNNITGSFDVDVNSSDSNAVYDFVYIDGELPAQMSEVGSRTVIDSYKFRNGEHELKIVEVGQNGQITVAAEQPVIFNNPIYCVDINDCFNIHSDYRIRGLHDGNSTLNVQIADINEQVIWSGADSGMDINIIVPQSVLSNQMFCSLSVSEAEGGGGMGMLTAGSGSGIAIDLIRDFERSDYNDVMIRMVIILPDKDVFKARKPAIEECAKACQNRSVSWVPLYYRDVTRENLNYLLSKPSVRYIYWCGHGNSHIGQNEEKVQRTHTICWERYIYWGIPYWYSLYSPIGVFSWTLQTKDDDPLPDDWDYRGFDLWGVHMDDDYSPMHDSGYKKIVFVDGCLSAKEVDMAQAYGMDSDWSHGQHDQIYIGWKREAFIKGYKGSNPGVRLFWERMGNGDTVYYALRHTATNGKTDERQALWGDNTVMELDNEDSDDNIRVYGEGLNNKL